MPKSGGDFRQVGASLLIAKQSFLNVLEVHFRYLAGSIRTVHAVHRYQPVKGYGFAK